MTRVTFNSIFREDMQSYIDLRINSMAWNTYRLDCYRLSSFDQFLCLKSFDQDIVPQEVINEWISACNVPEASIEGYIKAVRGFMQHRIHLGKPAYMPPYRKKVDLYIPYIFSNNELEDIFSYADELAEPKPKLAVKYIYIEMAMLLKLLYNCGLRLGEALNLRVKHFNFDDGVIKIFHGKKDKQRFVPVHDSMIKLLADYCSAIEISNQPEAFFFPGKNAGAHLSQITAERHFKSILVNLGIVKRNEDIHKRGPCLHCLRHCFMFFSFKQLEAGGCSVNLSLPYLSIYCGHESLLESEKYMKFSSELFDDEMLRFADFSSSLFPEVIL